MKMTNMHPLYEVKADRETGEWIGEPQSTGEAVDFAEWCARKDTDTEHFDHYEASWNEINDFGDEMRKEETRALRVIWA
ncbi:hypothetical protein FBT96_00590 [Rhodobacter capsulatus]|uniref:Uncharacterized protein n=1 Tax=Rhodobacter capsulatus TaxID=1061 RepID=A0A4U1K3D8_RHOCA|nr:hypothetical protein [Rhodobacter capsulatus]TKD26448.1 hypothetical protein FBT96_00590 [Rhodobacter capsulatus]